MFFPCVNACVTDMPANSYVYAPTSIVEKSRDAALSYEIEEEHEDFTYLQSQLCSDKLIIESLNADKNDPKNFSTFLRTPFGEVTVSFRYCPVQKRYNRFICGAGKYTDLMKKLDGIYENDADRKSIYKEIIRYLKSKPVGKGKNPLTSTRVNSKYKDKLLAYFCAILAVSDPCYGKGADGGKNVRAALTSDECKNGCSFKKFLDVSFYPMSQKKAYRLARRLVGRRRMKIKKETIVGFKNLTSNQSPVKPRAKRIVEN